MMLTVPGLLSREWLWSYGCIFIHLHDDDSPKPHAAWTEQLQAANSISVAVTLL